MYVLLFRMINKFCLNVVYICMYIDIYIMICRIGWLVMIIRDDDDDDDSYLLMVIRGE